MKYSIRLILICLLPLTAYTQSDFNFIPHDQWANYTAIAIGENAIATVGFGEECDRPYISYFDRTSGEELWHRFGPVGSEYGSYTDVAFADDGSVWAAGWTFESPDVIGDEKAILTHFSPQGETLIHTASSANNAHIELPGVEVLSDGHILWSAESYLDIRTPNGWASESSLNLNIPPLITAVLSSTRFAYTDGNTVQIRDKGSQLPLYIYNSDTAITSIIAQEEDVYWTDGLSLYHYHLPTETLSDYYIDTSNELRLAWQNEEILIYEFLTNNAQTWTFNTTSGVITEALSWQMPAQQLLQLEWREDGYYQLGTDVYETTVEDNPFIRPYYHGFIQRSQNLLPLPAPDIGIVGINAHIDSTNISVHDTYWFRGQIFWSVQVEVQNFSDTPVLDSIAIVSTSNEGSYCVESRYYDVFPVSIPAQSSAVIDFQFIDLKFVDQDEQGNFIVNEDLCFYTIAPDHRIDMNTVNNMFCENFNIVESTNITEQTNEIRVFPNPAQDRIMIELSGAYFESIQVYDMQGRKLQTEQIKQADFYELNLPNYSAGTYWIALKTDQGLYQQRVIVQE